MPDPISLKSFTNVQANRQVGLGEDGGLKDTGARKEFLGRLVSVIGRTDTQRQENTRATESFVQALKSAYGDQVGDWAQRELQSHIDNGKPLTGRRIQEMVQRAQGEHGEAQRTEALRYGEARKDDLMMGFTRNYQAEGGSLKPGDAEKAMFPDGWQDKFVERFQARLGELHQDDPAPPSKEIRDKALAQAFDDVVLSHSDAYFKGKVHDDKDPVDPLDSARDRFMDVGKRSPQVHQRITEFYEKEVAPLQEEIRSLGHGNHDNLPRLLDLPLKLQEMQQKFTALRNTMKDEGIPDRELGNIGQTMSNLKTHLFDSVLARAGMGARDENSDLLGTLSNMGKLARDAQDPQKREEMFRDPQVREQMAKLDFELETARNERGVSPTLSEGIDFLQGIVRQTAGMCSEVQGEGKLTLDVPPYLKHAVVQHAPRNQQPENTMGFGLLVGGNQQVKEGLELLDKLDSMVSNPSTPIQMKLDGAFHAQSLRGRIEQELGQKLDQGVLSLPFNTFLAKFTPAPQGEKLTQLDQALQDVARARHQLESGGGIPQGEREGLNRSIDQLREFLEPHMQGKESLNKESHWLHGITRTLERGMA